MSFSKIFVAFVVAEMNQASLRYTGVSCIHNQWREEARAAEKRPMGTEDGDLRLFQSEYLECTIASTIGALE